MKQCAAETPFVLRDADEFDADTVQQWETWIETTGRSDTGLRIFCVIHGEIAGYCQLTWSSRRKIRHRATAALSIICKYWGLGIATAMFAEMEQCARQLGMTQLELGHVEGNERAAALYARLGFAYYGAVPDAFSLPDGTMRREMLMSKKL